MKSKATIFILFAILFGCKKDNSPNIILNGALTNCPTNYTCTYNYYDNADFTNSNGNQPVRGNYRVFWYNSVNANICGAFSRFYFKTSLGSDSFDISSNQIAAGQIAANDFTCPCCYLAFIPKPVGGEIKGKRTDATHWLVNASIIFGNPLANNAPIDTLVVNQYFTSVKLP